jgi:hypothetical protein
MYRTEPYVLALHLAESIEDQNQASLSGMAQPYLEAF